MKTIETNDDDKKDTDPSNSSPTDDDDDNDDGQQYQRAHWPLQELDQTKIYHSCLAHNNQELDHNTWESFEWFSIILNNAWF